MITKTAELSDLKKIMRFAEEVCDDTGFREVFGYDDEVFREEATKMISSPDAEIFVATDGSEVVGMLGVTVTGIYFSSKSVLANCLFVWLRKEHRGTGVGARLLGKSYEWAKYKGATHHGVYVLPGDNFSRFDTMYRKHGYKPTEMTYTREVM